jgi:hypothetical protein
MRINHLYSEDFIMPFCSIRPPNTPDRFCPANFQVYARKSLASKQALKHPGLVHSTGNVIAQCA